MPIIRGILRVSEIVFNRMSSMTSRDSHVRSPIWSTKETLPKLPRNIIIATIIQRNAIYHSTNHIHRGIWAPHPRHLPRCSAYDTSGMSSYHSSVFLQLIQWLLPVQKDLLRVFFSRRTAEKLPTHAPRKKIAIRMKRDIKINIKYKVQNTKWWNIFVSGS